MRMPLAILLALTAPLAAQEHTKTAPAQEGAEVVWIQAYPISKCLVSGKKLKPGKAKIFEAAGRTFKTCCNKCKKKVLGAPEKFAAKLDEAIAAAQLADYPLKTCPLSGKKLKEGKARNVVLDGQLVRVCCKRCAKKAPSKKAELVAKVRQALLAQQRKQYAAKKCPVSDHGVDEHEPLDVMYGNHLVRLCCEDCLDEFKKSPEKYLAKVAGKHGKATEHGHGEKHEKHEGHDHDGRPAPSSPGGEESDCCAEGAAAGKSCCEAEKQAGGAKKGCCEGGKPEKNAR